MNLEGSGCAFIIGLILFGLFWGTPGMFIWLILCIVGWALSD